MTQKSFSADSAFPPLKPGVLRLYSMRFCPFAQRARLVLEHKNIAFETVNIDLKSKPDWFLKKNPLGTVPVLEIDDKIVYESTAASEWLDDVYPQNSLQPKDPYRKAWDRIHFEYFGKVQPVFYGLLFPTDNKEKVIQDVNEHYKYYEDVLASRGGPFFGGSGPAMIDLYCWPIFERLAVLSGKEPAISVDKSKFPNLAAWYEAMYKQPAVKATMWDDKVHNHFFESMKNGTPDYDYGLEQ